MKIREASKVSSDFQLFCQLHARELLNGALHEHDLKR